MSRIALATLVAMTLVGGLGFSSRDEASATDPVSLAVDADPSGNTATALGTIERCVSVQTGDTFSIDIVIADVVDLLGWSADLIYDPSVLTVVDRDVNLFLGANAGSNVFDASEAPPGQSGRYHVAAADIADPPVPDSGAGVLTRLTLKALAPGVSPAAIPRLDLGGDGTVDVGPILTDAAGHHIGDDDGDGYFDGPAADAWVAVDSPCPDKPPTVFPSPPPARTTPSPTGTPAILRTLTSTPTTPPPIANGGSDGPPWAIIGAAAGVAILLAAGLGLWRRLGRRRSR